MSHPSWLNEKYFQDILITNYKNTSIKVHKIKIEPCGDSNDGFLSTLLRVGVEFTKDSAHEFKSFVVKMETHQEIAIKTVGPGGYDVQTKEMHFFEVVGPSLEKIMKNSGETGSLVPKTEAIDRDRGVIVIEDLKTLNYQMVDRLVGLDEVQTKLALTQLAKLHAASKILHQTHPKAFDCFGGVFSRKTEGFNDVILSIFEVAAEEVATWTGFEKYAKKLKMLEGKLIENATKCLDIEPNEFCVLNHGDLWTNNLMYKFDENGKANHLIFVSIHPSET